MITLDELLNKINKLSKTNKIKIIDGDIKARDYFMVEDLILSFYDREPYKDVKVIYRGMYIRCFSKGDFDLIYRRMIEEMENQIKNDFEIKKRFNIFDWFKNK